MTARDRGPEQARLPEIPGYRIEKPIGRAGHLPLYAARRVSDDSAVVVKIVGGASVAGGVDRERFRREIVILEALQHPHVITIVEHGAYSDGLYLVMPALAGGSLRERIRVRLPLDDALGIARTLAGALGAAHGAGVVHRNVKPDNVLFDASGAVVLSDFGLARATALGKSLTGEGAVVGSPRYMSPEQIRDLPTTARSDLYSLGVLLFEMVSGDPPFRGADFLSVAIEHLTSPLPALPDAPPGVAALIGALCAKAPDDRPADAQAVVAAIERLVSRPRASREAAAAPFDYNAPTRSTST